MPRVVDPPAWQVATDATLNGCFETMRAYGGRIFRIEDHLARLYASAQFLGTRAPADRRGLARQLTEALTRSGLREAIVRVALMPRPPTKRSMRKSLMLFGGGARHHPTPWRSRQRRLCAKRTALRASARGWDQGNTHDRLAQAGARECPGQLPRQPAPISRRARPEKLGGGVEPGQMVLKPEDAAAIRPHGLEAAVARGIRRHLPARRINDTRHLTNAQGSRL